MSTMSLTTIPWERYEREYAPVHDRIFSGRDPLEGAFADAGWLVVLLLGGLYLEDEVLSALAGAAGGQGDDAFIVGYRDTVFEDQPPVRAAWTPAALEEVRTGTSFGHVDVDLFGTSATWGLVASTENFAVLGATGEVMQDFVRRIDGGAERLRGEFLQAARDGQIGFGDAGARYADQLMSRVGWAPSPRDAG
jgi:hypothetical protein